MTDITPTERALRQAQSGDDAALDELIALIQPQLQRLSMKICGHTQDAEDVMQDSLLAVARGIQGFRADSSLSTWMYTIARRFCIRRRAKKAGEPSQFVPLEHLPSMPQGFTFIEPDRAAQLQQQWVLLQEALVQLDIKYREVFVLRQIEGLSAAQVSEVLGISQDAVKSRLHRARKHVREALFCAQA